MVREIVKAVRFAARAPQEPARLRAALGGIGVYNSQQLIFTEMYQERRCGKEITECSKGIYSRLY